MKNRAILFNGPMVRALLNGSKTQTRRIYKSKNGGLQPRANDLPGMRQVLRECPHGQPGERLWVRETFCHKWDHERGYLDEYWYRASTPDVDHVDGGEKSPWMPSIHMPRVASRITLEITGVRVERLQDISDADAWAEGIDSAEALSMGCTTGAARAAYSALWERINGADSWDANPWVWVVEFRQIEAATSAAVSR